MPATQALEDLRIIDLTSGPAGGLATMIMADFGAQVLRICGPKGDRLDNLAAAPMWHRGKDKSTLDFNNEDDRDRFESLCASADILVTTWRPASLHRHSLNYEALHRRHPHLIYCHITGFGSRGPLANLPAYEHLVAAYSGRMLAFSGIVDRPGPVFSALQVGIHACAQSAVSGTLAALLSQSATHTTDSEKAHGAPSEASAIQAKALRQEALPRIGRLVETSLLQGMLPYEQGAMLGVQFRKSHPNLPVMTPPENTLPPPSLYYHPIQAGDGKWLQFGNLLPHLFDNFLIATELADVIADPAFDARQLRLVDQQAHEAFRDRMMRRIQQRRSHEWMTDLIADGGVVAAPYQTTQAALSDPDVVANGHAISLADGEMQLGPLATLTQTPADPGQIVNTRADDLVSAWANDPRPPSGVFPNNRDAGNSALPLSGVRVIEIATIIAAPLGASFLADMGADVIKIEQVGGDPYRGLAAGIGATRVNAGKRSVCLDLKSEAGQQAAQRLIQQADVLIHNYRPGVPERLGIGYAQLSEHNANLVYVQCNGYGPEGPGAQRPSTHPIPGAAMGGVMYQMRELLPEEQLDFDEHRLWASRIMRANEVNPDPNTALVVANAALLGLNARRSTGAGQQIFVDMFGANAYANHDDFLSYRGKQPRITADPDMLGLGPCYRLYACAQDSWIFLALCSQRERDQFAQAMESAGYSGLSELFEGVDDLPSGDVDGVVAQSLSNLFGQHPADYWQDLGTSANVGCVRADKHFAHEFWLADEQSAAMDLYTPASHPLWGSYDRHGPNVIFDGLTRRGGSAPLAGQHNHEALSDIGYAADEIDSMETNGVLWRDPHLAET